MMILKDLFGCVMVCNKGICDNWLNIWCDVLEVLILNGLCKYLMDFVLFREFCDEFIKEVNCLCIECGVDLEGWKWELECMDCEFDKVIDVIL